MTRLPARTFIMLSAAAALLGASCVSGSAVAAVPVHAAGRPTFTTWRVIYRTHTGLGPAAATGPRHVWVLDSSASENFLLRWNGSSWRKMKPMPTGFGAKVFSPFLIKASGRATCGFSATSPICSPILKRSCGMAVRGSR